MTGIPPLRPAPGGHGLPTVFRGGPATPRRRRRGGRGVLLGLAGALALITAAGSLQLAANLRYDGVRAAFDDASAVSVAAQSGLDDARDELETSVDAAARILPADVHGLTDAATEVALQTAADASEGALEEAGEVVSAEIPDAGAKPLWFWELLGESTRLGDEQVALGHLDRRIIAALDAVADSAQAVDAAGAALLAAAASNAAVFEAAHVSATNDTVIALRSAARIAASTTTFDGSAAIAFSALQTAAGAVVASEIAELAAKSGPLYDARIEVEAFGRSLAPGVLLEFDWDAVVNGAGSNGSMGGFTTWWWDDPGRAVIQLSDSVAMQWPADRSRALVAHEVGHAISVKCRDKYDASTQDSIEMWATAWAISMGYTDDANGVWAYGYPPQEYIDAASGCR